MSWYRRLANTFRSGRAERDIRREIAFHLAERTDQLRTEGYSEEEARRRAERQFGNVTLQAERTRDMDISLLADAVLRDIRYAVRSLSRTPGFTVTVILTLGLGIGANSAVFSAVDAVLLRPLPFPDADRLMELRQRVDGTSETNIAPVRLEEWHVLNRTFTAISGYFTEDVSEVSGEFPVRLKRAFVAPRFVDVWGVEPAIGRSFSEGEHRTGGPRGIIVSHRYWRDRLGSDPQVLTRTVRIGSSSVPIIGVMPATFLFPDRAVDLWSPVATDSSFSQSRQNTWYLGIGRLQPGVTLQEARANLAAVQAQLAQTHGDTDARMSVEIEPLKDTAVGGVRRSLWLLFGGVSLLLLITCTNVAALVLSRTARRRQELALRVSLGASRLAVARQMLIEMLVLSITGGGLGLLVASGSVAILRSTGIDLPRADEIAVDGRIVLYTFASAVIVAVICAILPASRAAHEHLIGRIQEGARAVGSPRYALQWWLVGAQVALSVTLLAGAGLLVRSVQALWQVEPGFDARQVLAFRISGNWGETTDQARLLQRISTSLEQLRGLPGVEAAATSGWSLPGVPTEWETIFALVEAQGDADRRLVAEGRSVSPEYFATMRIPVVAGELCRRRGAAADGSFAARDVMVNRTFVTRYLSAQSPIGLHLAQPDNDFPASRIVGVVGDARERGLDREAGPTVYWCDIAPNPTPYFLLRTAADPAAVAPTVRAGLKQIEPLRAVYEIGPLEERIGGAFAQNRLRAMLLALFATTALALTCIGVYGTLSYAVSIRRREVGLRLALGAVPGGVLRQFVFEGLRVVGVSCLGGLALTVAFTQLLSGMLYGVSPTDPLTLASVVTIVLAVASIAAAVPALRAARLDAAEVLREG